MRYIKYLLALLAAFCFLAVPVSAEGAESKPLYAKDINNGSYEITVDSSSSMFRIIECTLTVTDNEMTAVMTMSGQGYGKLFMGTGEEALNADESEFIPYVEGEDGKHRFTVPVKALDTPVKCAAWSKKREQWYDRDLVFRSDSLPDGAIKAATETVVIIVAAAVGALAVCLSVIIIVKRKKNDK